MQRKKGLAYINLFAVLLLAAVGLSYSLCGCSGGGNASAYDPATEYARAVQNAAQEATDASIPRNLIAVTKTNQNLIWDRDPTDPNALILVVSFVKESVARNYMCPSEGCQPGDVCKEGRECPGYRWDNWVTTAPELKNFFGASPPTDNLRLVQLLGLPPGDVATRTYFIEFWVSPKDLYRPSPDPEISDHEAEADFSDDIFRVYSARTLWADQTCPGETPGWKDYKGWFTNRKTCLYTSANPYPWSRLGYTYDWGNPANPVGLSEFVLNGSREDGTTITVGVHSVKYWSDYFN
jgi:hypothetical protein